MIGLSFLVPIHLTTVYWGATRVTFKTISVALVGFRVVKSTKMRNPICTTLLLTENFIFQSPKECVEVVGHPVRHKTPESNKSLSGNIASAKRTNGNSDGYYSMP